MTIAGRIANQQHYQTQRVAYVEFGAQDIMDCVRQLLLSLTIEFHSTINKNRLGVVQLSRLLNTLYLHIRFLDLIRYSGNFISDFLD